MENKTDTDWRLKHFGETFYSLETDEEVTYCKRDGVEFLCGKQEEPASPVIEEPVLVFVEHD